jgi:TonB family protein
MAVMLLAGCTGLETPQFPLNALAPEERGLRVYELTDPGLSPPKPLSTERRLLDQFTYTQHGDEDWEGAATVDFIVDEKGLPREVRLVYASEPDYGAVAVRTVAQWRYSPGTMDGQPVRVHVQAPLLNGASSSYSSAFHDAGAPGSPPPEEPQTRSVVPQR